MKDWDVSAIYTGSHERYDHPSHFKMLAELESDFLDIVTAERNILDYVVNPEYTIGAFSVTTSLSLADHFADADTDDRYLD